MTGFSFDTMREEASLRVAFSGNRIERRAETRADDAARRALDRPDARLLVIDKGRVLLRMNGGAAFAPYFARAEAEALGACTDDAVLLGHEGSEAVLAAPLATNAEALPGTVKAIDFRSVFRQGLIDPPALGALAQGAALLAWNADHLFCGRCGARTEPRAGGYKRACTGCGREHFPRTDPVVIMLAVDGEDCLLGRSPHFAPGMVSCLAGFVEPGETIEAAVRREIGEESGIAIGRVAYHASQPWPFPYSLMIGCYAEGLSRAITTDDELEECRWFARAEVRQMLEGTHPRGRLIPPGGSIAGILIGDWAKRG